MAKCHNEYHSALLTWAPVEPLDTQLQSIILKDIEFMVRPGESHRKRFSPCSDWLLFYEPDKLKDEATSNSALKFEETAMAANNAMGFNDAKADGRIGFLMMLNKRGVLYD